MTTPPPSSFLRQHMTMMPQTHPVPSFTAITFGSCLLLLVECSELFGCAKAKRDPILALKELEINEAEDDISTKQSKCLFEGDVRREGLAKALLANSARDQLVHQLSPIHAHTRTHTPCHTTDVFGGN